jgi:hypothetical protein
VTETSLYILTKLQATVDQIDKGVIGSLFQFCLQECSTQTEIFPSALLVVVATSRRTIYLPVLKSEFDDLKVQEICSYASKALKNEQNEELMKAGLESVGDLLRSFPQAMRDHASGLIEYMLESLGGTKISKDLRVSVISTLGDIALSCPGEVKVRLQVILQVYLYAFEAVVSLITTEVANRSSRLTAPTSSMQTA